VQDDAQRKRRKIAEELRTTKDRVVLVVDGEKEEPPVTEGTNELVTDDPDEHPTTEDITREEETVGVNGIRFPRPLTYERIVAHQLSLVLSSDEMTKLGHVVTGMSESKYVALLCCRGATNETDSGPTVITPNPAQQVEADFTSVGGKEPIARTGDNEKVYPQLAQYSRE
jgi:hypothetical protein